MNKKKFEPHKKILICFSCKTENTTHYNPIPKEVEVFCYCKKCGKYLTEIIKSRYKK